MIQKYIFRSLENFCSYGKTTPPLGRCLFNGKSWRIISTGNFVQAFEDPDPEDQHSAERIKCLSEEIFSTPFVLRMWFRSSQPSDRHFCSSIEDQGWKKLSDIKSISLNRETVRNLGRCSSFGDLRIKRVESCEEVDKVYWLFHKCGLECNRQVLSVNRLNYFLASLNSTPVGLASLYVHTDNGRKIAGFYENIVLPQFRNQGIGTALTLKRIEAAVEQGSAEFITHCSDPYLAYTIYKTIGIADEVKLTCYEKFYSCNG